MSIKKSSDRPMDDFVDSIPDVIECKTLACRSQSLSRSGPLANGSQLPSIAYLSPAPSRRLSSGNGQHAGYYTVVRRLLVPIFDRWQLQLQPQPLRSQSGLRPWLKCDVSVKVVWETGQILSLCSPGNPNTRLPTRKQTSRINWSEID
jgi:hypothetical protein